MFGRTGVIRLGRLFGIPIQVDYTWFIIFFLVTFALSTVQFPSQYWRWSAAEAWAVGIATSLLFFASVVAHELAHALVAQSRGIPVKSITLFVFGGIAQISRESSRALPELFIALVGPLCSIVLAGLFWTLQQLLPVSSQHLQALTGWLARINLMVGVFNLVPGFPLDGGRVLRAILWALSGNYRMATRIATRLGQGVAVVLISVGVLSIFIPGIGIGGFWFVLIGWFLWSAASGSYQQSMLRDALRGFKVQDMMGQALLEVPGTLSLQRLVDEHVRVGGHRAFLVGQDGLREGFMTVREVRKVPQVRWGLTTVREVMLFHTRLRSVSPQDDIVTVLEILEDLNASELPVVENGNLRGIISREQITSYLRTRAELGV